MMMACVVVIVVQKRFELSVVVVIEGFGGGINEINEFKEING